MKVKQWLQKHHITQERLADVLNLSFVSVSKKLNDHEDFTLAQIRIMYHTYHIPLELFI